MGGIYFDASFGGVAFMVTSIQTERGADVVVHSPATGDTHGVSRRGRRHVKCTCEVLFCSQPGLDHYLDRYDALVKAFEQGTTDIFSHPLDGAYRAQVSELTANATNDELAVRSTVVFLRDDEAPVVFQSGAGVSVGAGVEAVSTAAQVANSELAEVGFEPDVAIAREDLLEYQILADCRDSVDAWDEAAAEGTLDSNQVFLEIASLAQRIDEQIIELGLRDKLANWGAYEQMLLLRYELSRAAESFTADSENVFEVFVDQPRPMLAICAELYGASSAVDRADNATRSNRVRTPGLVPRGTRLKMLRPRSA